MSEINSTRNSLNGLHDLYYSNIQVSIDTFTLVAKLTTDQIGEVFNRIYFDYKNPYQDKYFKYSAGFNSFVFKLFPRNPLTSINYNAMIHFFKNASLSVLPQSIKEILQFDTWKIKRMDIAFDYSNDTPFSSFSNRLLLKHHGNVKFIQKEQNDKGWLAEYMGTLNSKTDAKACCYDRNEKDNTDKYEYPLRYEIRLRPKMNEYNQLTKLDHGWIEKKLEKFVYIPDIELLPLNKWDKRRLYKVQKDYDYLKTLPIKKQKELKNVVKEHRVRFDTIYGSIKDNLFSFLNIEVPNNPFSTKRVEQIHFDKELFE